MSVAAALLLGLGLGLRHATDADHVVVLASLVSEGRGRMHAARVAGLWGLGHSASFFAVGIAMILFDVRLPEAVNATLEIIVAAMLVVLGGYQVAKAGGAVRDQSVRPHQRLVRPVVIGLVHGLAGSAAVALVAMTTVDSRTAALGYLAFFAVGTVLGMVAFTLMLAGPLAIAAATRRGSVAIMRGAGALSVALGLVLAVEVAAGR